MKKVLIIGSGGREHALVKAMKSSPQVSEVFAAPGNGGIAQEATCVSIGVSDFPGLIDYAKEKQIDLTIVGPEQPLTEGIVDAFQQAGLKIFGPNRAAAILEASKSFTKDFLKKYGIPTADYAVFSNKEEAEAFLYKNEGKNWVIKVDGLAAGKGVFVTQNIQEALDALKVIFEDKSFGDQPVVIEEFLDGEELSFIVLCDGETALPLASSQDHKRLLDHDLGPNTGGMGAYSPAPLLNAELEEKIMKKIIYPTLKGMAAEERRFSGVLYAGLMIINNEPYVLEYNVRFGDPEAQVILPRLKSDWLDLFEAAIAERLDQIVPVWKDEAAVCVVLAAGGYPQTPRKGDVIEGLEAETENDLANSYVYHAGTQEEGGEIVTAGGRVLGVTALGKDLASAVKNCYQRVKTIHFSGMQYRQDIAAKGLKRLSVT